MQKQSMRQLQEQMNGGELTAFELVTYYLQRIHQYNPLYNVIIQVNENALAQAEELDKERIAKGPRSMLHGIPILVKDNMNTNYQIEGLYTTGGAHYFEHQQVLEDAYVIKQLRAAGAIILGKANLSEFANFKADEPPNGFSVLGGQAHNPYGIFDIGGSSSGSGGALAMDMACATLGTETSGSIISPATENSVIALKPTVGLVSTHGVIPISWTQDTVGPMAHHVEDIEIIMECISEAYREDTPYQQDIQRMTHNNQPTQYRIGVPQGEFLKGLSSDQLKLYLESVDRLENIGISIIPLEIDLKGFTVNWDVLFYEFPIALSNYFRSTPGMPDDLTLEQIVAYNANEMEHRAPHGQGVFMKSIEMQSQYELNYHKQLKLSQTYSEQIETVLNNNQLDFLCFCNTKGSDWAARGGYPSLCIPMGYTSLGEPEGLVFTGRKFSDKQLLLLGKFIENSQLFQHKWPEISLES